MKTVTVDQMLAFGPCDDYTRERITELWAGKDALTPMEISRLDIPAADRVWALCHVLDADIRQRWIDGIADRTVRNHALHCGITEVEAWAAKWLDGTDRTARAAVLAAEAAVLAAVLAAVFAARAAARAAEAAARAARAAARAAEAAVLAARAAEKEAEYELQIKELQQLMEDEK